MTKDDVLESLATAKTSFKECMKSGSDEHNLWTDLLIRNIEQKRSFLQNLLTVAFGLIGAIIGLNLVSIKIEVPLIVIGILGAAFLLVSATISITYLFVLLSRENKRITDRLKIIVSTYDVILKDHVDFLPLIAREEKTFHDLSELNLKNFAREKNDLSEVDKNTPTPHENWEVVIVLCFMFGVFLAFLFFLLMAVKE